MNDSIDNSQFIFDDALFDDPAFNKFNCPLPQDGPDLIQEALARWTKPSTSCWVWKYPHQIRALPLPIWL